MSIEHISNCIPQPVALRTNTDVLALSSVEIPIKIIAAGENFGVQAAIDLLFQECLIDKSFTGAAAITIMEALYKNGFREKVWMFGRMHGMALAETLENNTQKAEFYIRVAALFKDTERTYFQNLAIDLLKPSLNCQTLRCPSHSLIQLARLFAEEGDVDHAIYWLSRTEPSRKDYRDLTEVFFQKGLFEEGVRLLDSSSEKSAVLMNKEDYVELLAQGTKDKELLKDPEFQEALLNFQNDSQKAHVFIKWCCSSGETEWGLKIAKNWSLKNDSIFYLLNFSQQMTINGSSDNYLSVIREIASRSMKPFEAVKDIARSKLFSVSEDIQTCSLLKKISWKIQILWERICGITNKYPTFNRDLNSEDRKDVELLLSAISELLLATSPEESWDGYPPYWVSVMRTYMEYGFYEKALEFGDQWKSWYALAEPSSSRRDSPIWMLSLLGLCKMAMGHDIDGLNDLKTASDLQQKVWEKYPEYANDFYFDVLNAIIYLSPGIRSGQLTGCKEEFFQRLKSISKLDFQAIKDTYYS